MTDLDQQIEEARGCEVCDFDGYVDIPDPETGGVLGPAPCPDPECPSNGGLLGWPR